VTKDELIERCVKQDELAQEELYLKFYPVVYKICMRYANDLSEAKDMTQDCFIKIFMKIKQYKGLGSFDGWLKRVAVTTAIDIYNKNKKYKHHIGLEESMIFENANSTETLETTSVKDSCGINDSNPGNINIDIVRSANFDYDELIGVLQLIPEPFRIIFNLFVIEEYTHEEIAAMLDINIKTSWSRLFRAKQMFQKKLSEQTILKMRNLHELGR
jgi:RNA polymerase sigma factor (sigma-70 family)